MRNIIEWFFSLFISKSEIKEFRKEELAKLRKEYTEYKNKEYLSRLKKRR